MASSTSINVYAQPSANTHHALSGNPTGACLSNYPCVGFILLHPCLLSCLTCALKVCATGLPQGAQIPPLHPPFLYLHALKKILVVKL